VLEAQEVVVAVLVNLVVLAKVLLELLGKAMQVEMTLEVLTVLVAEVGLVEPVLTELLTKR
jgi:hypothetical protein